jgi:hypothetical protein
MAIIGIDLWYIGFHFAWRASGYYSKCSRYQYKWKDFFKLCCSDQRGRHVREFLKEIIGRYAESYLDPIESVAQRATIQAGVLSLR